MEPTALPRRLHDTGGWSSNSVPTSRCSAASLHEWIVLTALVLLASSQVGQAQDARTNWLTGPELERRLELPVGVSWSGVPFRAAVMHFARQQQVAVLIDRRVDPDASFELQAQNVSVEEMLLRIASRRGVGAARLGSTYYFGPRQTAERLRTIAELRRGDVANVPPARRAAFLRARAWGWSDLATPSELFDALSKEAGIPIRGAERAPHDLWAAADLPPLVWTDRLTLLAAQYDLTFAIAADGASVQLVPMPEKPRSERVLAIAPSMSIAPQQLAEQFPSAEIRKQGGKLHVRGTNEDLDALAAVLRGQTVRRRTVTEAPKVHTLRVNRARLDQVLKELEQLDLTFDVDKAALAAAGIRLDVLVSLDVEGASTEELLQAVVEPIGLEFELDGKLVKIRPRGEPEP